MANIQSPCSKICVADPVSAHCIGCGRSLAEIEGWISFTDTERTRIMATLPERLRALRARASSTVDTT